MLCVEFLSKLIFVDSEFCGSFCICMCPSMCPHVRVCSCVSVCACANNFEKNGISSYITSLKYCARLACYFSL